ncbi:hypothetical protein ACN4EG_08720 [Alkalinema pantanalense CENA528]|uniref:hypothetical protein n=1 Tax=Alkalinema pantanalense TaxID=1620705 RepID=UPI003D6FEBDB
MIQLHCWLTSTAIAVTLSFPAVAGDSKPDHGKLDQCNQLITITNTATTELQDTSTAKGEAVETMKKMVEILDRNVQSFKGISLSDPRLQGFQQRLVGLYANTRDAGLMLVKAAERKDEKAMQDALVILTAASEEELPLIDDINRYCNAKEGLNS